MANMGLGNYNPMARQKEIKAKLEIYCGDIRKKWESKTKKVPYGKPCLGKRDSLMTKINDTAEEVRNLETAVDEFKGPHFTQLYRTLNERCAQYQIKLDKIPVDGRDELKQERKKVLLAADAAVKKLAQKVHQDGKLCPECELKQL